MGKIVVNGLVGKRAEIAGEIKETERQLRVMRESLSHLDATIRLLDSSIELSQIKAKRAYRKNHLFGTGEANRLVREALRDTGDAPLSTADITEQLLVQRGLDQDAASIKIASAVVSRTLYRMEQSGQVRKAGSNGRVAAWVLV